MMSPTKRNPPEHAPKENPKTVPFGDENIPIGEKVGRVRAVFDSVAPKYDLMNDITSLGAHRIWKAAAIDRLMPRPTMRVVDVAGGTADMAMRIAERVGTDAMSQAGGHISVMDINPAMMEIGQGRVKQAQMADAIDFTCANAEALPLDDNSVDAYIIAFGLRNVTNPEQALAEARRVLAPGGHFLCLEFSHPKWPLLKPLYDGYSDHIMPRIGGWIAGDDTSYRYLAESIRRFPNQETLKAVIEHAGLEQVTVTNLTGGIAAIHSAWRL
ncbi:MAG: bifunctional demethylmenaquinone methyltransferase/2-methoxy-6-polyprenyl-1,4-benzoquinol methylase UbiE [Alphaproteobacteria bacterium]|jgi:demethylmenaquinone methyltransferase/2-methoxy-6-polyprenyl-1,4-benzoquinol methylase